MINGLDYLNLFELLCYRYFPMKPGRPKSKDPKSRTLIFRTTVKTENRIKHLAAIYADGDLSRWLTHAGLNAPRKRLK